VVGYPKTLRVDNGPELVSRDLDLWAYQRGVTLDFSRPGKPTDNAFAESCNGKVRAECLNTAWFRSLNNARPKYQAWHRDYHERFPHRAFGDKCPIELMNGAGAYGPSGT
jgi:putative transposase